MEFAKLIAKQFNIDSEVVSVSEMSSGHINDTYLVSTISGKHYVLQKLNKSVFKDIVNVIGNKVLISEHLFN